MQLLIEKAGSGAGQRHRAGKVATCSGSASEICYVDTLQSSSIFSLSHKQRAAFKHGSQASGFGHRLGLTPGFWVLLEPGPWYRVWHTWASGSPSIQETHGGVFKKRLSGPGPHCALGRCWRRPHIEGGLNSPVIPWHPHYGPCAPRTAVSSL